MNSIYIHDDFDDHSSDAETIRAAATWEDLDMKTLFATLATVTLLATVPAAAATYVRTATTAGGPTFNRPLAGTPPTGLSSVGTAVHYDPFTFTVSASGSYSFLDASTYDNFLILYSGTFNPATPLANALVANDDLAGVGNAGFTAALAAGTTYIAVATAFNNANSGAYTLTITGPGDVIAPGAGAVPEPASWALMIAGFGLLGGTMRARRARVAFA